MAGRLDASSEAVWPWSPHRNPCPPPLRPVVRVNNDPLPTSVARLGGSLKGKKLVDVTVNEIGGSW